MRTMFIIDIRRVLKCERVIQADSILVVHAHVLEQHLLKGLDRVLLRI